MSVSKVKDPKSKIGSGRGMSKGTGEGQVLRERLAEALRANLLRRKAQKRERALDSDNFESSRSKIIGIDS